MNAKMTISVHSKDADLWCEEPEETTANYNHFLCVSVYRVHSQHQQQLCNDAMRGEIIATMSLRVTMGN